MNWASSRGIRIGRLFGGGRLAKALLGMTSPGLGRGTLVRGAGAGEYSGDDELPGGGGADPPNNTAGCDGR